MAIKFNQQQTTNLSNVTSTPTASIGTLADSGISLKNTDVFTYAKNNPKSGTSTTNGLTKDNAVGECSSATANSKVKTSEAGDGKSTCERLTTTVQNDAGKQQEGGEADSNNINKDAGQVKTAESQIQAKMTKIANLQQQKTEIIQQYGLNSGELQADGEEGFAQRQQQAQQANLAATQGQTGQAADGKPGQASKDGDNAADSAGQDKLAKDLYGLQTAGDAQQVQAKGGITDAQKNEQAAKGNTDTADAKKDKKAQAQDAKDQKPVKTAENKSTDDADDPEKKEALAKVKRINAQLTPEITGADALRARETQLVKNSTQLAQRRFGALNTSTNNANDTQQQAGVQNNNGQQDQTIGKVTFGIGVATFAIGVANWWNGSGEVMMEKGTEGQVTGMGTQAAGSSLSGAAGTTASTATQATSTFTQVAQQVGSAIKNLNTALKAGQAVKSASEGDWAGAGTNLASAVGGAGGFDKVADAATNTVGSTSWVGQGINAVRGAADTVGDKIQTAYNSVDNATGGAISGVRSFAQNAQQTAKTVNNTVKLAENAAKTAGQLFGNDSEKDIEKLAMELLRGTKSEDQIPASIKPAVLAKKKEFQQSGGSAVA